MLKLTSHLDLDARLLQRSDVRDSSLLLRRARIGAKAKPTQNLRLEVEPSFDEEKAGVADAFMKWTPCGAFALTAGRFRIPFGWESSQPSFRLPFAERGVESKNDPGRNTGLMITLAPGWRRATLAATLFQNGRGEQREQTGAHFEGTLRASMRALAFKRAFRWDLAAAIHHGYRQRAEGFSGTDSMDYAFLEAPTVNGVLWQNTVDSHFRIYDLHLGGALTSGSAERRFIHAFASNPHAATERLQAWMAYSSWQIYKGSEPNQALTLSGRYSALELSGEDGLMENGVRLQSLTAALMWQESANLHWIADGGWDFYSPDADTPHGPGKRQVRFATLRMAVKL